MTGKWTSSLLAAAMAIAAAPSLAATADGHFAAKGAGRARCADFVDAKAGNTPEHLEFVSFIEGYITAANRYEAETFDIAPWHTTGIISVIVDNYCRTNRDESIATLANKIAAALKPLRLSAESRMVEFGEGAQRIWVYEEVVRRAQIELKRRGLFAGEANGRPGPETAAAMQKFQTTRQLPATGIPDAATLWFLLNP